ncbi:MAG: BatD family protein [Verrucomicrobiales bacterium]
MERPGIARQILATTILFLCAAATVEAAEVSVQVEPRSFSVDRGGQLAVTVSGADFDEAPNPPSPEGVSVRPYGQSQNIQIINGRMTRSVTQNFVVSAEEPGDYTIPSFEVRAGGQTVETEPVAFTVTSGPAGAQGGAADTPRTKSFLDLEFPARDRDHLYVGEMVPVRITAYFPADSRVSLRSAPRPEGEGFTLHNLSEEPEQNFEIVDGENYRTVTWSAGISTVKAGEYPLEVSLDATVMVRERSRSRQRSLSPFGGRSLFDDPFFDNAFARMVPREVTLSSGGEPAEIRSLPTEGRPDNFSGAVGSFSLGAFKLPADAATGEPRKIRVTVEGEGNFDRMDAPTLEPADAWKTYTPKTEFIPGDATSFSGSKTFEFSAVPLKAGEHKTRLAFSYFDPEKGSYETVVTPEISLTVDEGEDLDPRPSATADSPAVDEAAAAEEAGDAPVSLAPPRLASSSRPAFLVAPFRESGFWIVVFLAMTGIALGFAAGTLRRRRSDPRRLAARRSAKAAHDAVTAAEAAAQSGDAVAFFAAARRALQTRLAVEWDRPPESITLAELRHRLPPDSPALAIFAQADAIQYAPAGARPDLPPDQWRAALQRALEEVSPDASETPRKRSVSPA